MLDILITIGVIIGGIWLLSFAVGIAAKIDREIKEVIRQKRANCDRSYPL